MQRRREQARDNRWIRGHQRLGLGALRHLEDRHAAETIEGRTCENQLSSISNIVHEGEVSIEDLVFGRRVV